MKQLSLIGLLLLLVSLPGNAQFWIRFGWNEPHCQNCLWMEQAMHLSPRQAADYHKMVHRYGQKIEKEAQKHYRYWDQSARKIYTLRMERDRRLQSILTPSQFRLYVRFVREHPQRIHDYRGWFNNPHYPSYRPSYDCRHYEDRYWTSRWEYTNGRWHDHFESSRRPPIHSDRPIPPTHPNHPIPPVHPDRPNRPGHSEHRPAPDSSRPGKRSQRNIKSKKEKEHDLHKKNQSYKKGRRDRSDD